MLFASFCFVVILGSINAQTFSMGNCNPNLETVQNFNKEQFAGKWYEIQRSYNRGEVGKKCNIFNHNLSSSHEHVYTVNNTFVYKNNSKQLQTIFYYLDADDLNVGKLKFGPGFISDEQPFWILATDYDEYLVAYSCLNVYKGKLEWIWIHSQKQHPPISSIKLAETAVRDRNITVKLIFEEQTCK